MNSINLRLIVFYLLELANLVNLCLVAYSTIVFNHFVHCFRHLNHLRRNPEAAWIPDPVESITGLDSGELVIAGIYVRLFIANPGWVLRKPREFLSDLLEEATQLLKSNSPDASRLDSVTTALVKLLTFQPPLAEMVPGTGYLARIFNIMADIDQTRVKEALLIINELTR